MVSLGLFNIAQTEEQISLDLSQLEAPNDVVMVTDYLTNASNNTILTNSTAYVDGHFLCSSNMSEAVRGAINGIIPIDPVCGMCGKNINIVNLGFPSA